MRLWHYQLLPYLPDAQFKGQLRELVAIMHDWRDKGKTNHLLINRVMEYPKSEFHIYFEYYEYIYQERYGKSLRNYLEESWDFGQGCEVLPSNGGKIFDGWHNTEYLRVCMANLYEKHFFGVGKSRITDEEWQTLLDGYKNITGEEYVI